MASLWPSCLLLATLASSLPPWPHGSHLGLPSCHLGLLLSTLVSWLPSWPHSSHLGLMVATLAFLVAILASWWPSWPHGCHLGLAVAILFSCWPPQAAVGTHSPPAPLGFSLPFSLPLPFLSPQDPRSSHADDVDPGPPAGRNPSAGPLPRPRPLAGRHVGPQPRPLARLRAQHDGTQPRAPQRRAPAAPPGSRRLRSGQHAPDAQGEQPQLGAP